MVFVTCWQGFLSRFYKLDMNDGPILYVGGDEDDRYLVTDALEAIGRSNKVINFDNGMVLVDYLKSNQERPFIILCDLYLPQMTGLELKEHINSDDQLKRRTIPFIFLSESVNPKDVDDAYMSLVQGFYVKVPTFEGLKKQLRIICEYWETATLPGEKL
ncbi:response regulator [Dyadobacter flavalbus]|uniref:Response regulator n=2 Tax=Dyadobacter flavalbus TaxID=2579942 RepID=A0A5M8QPB5_9BACT|nr:response regulator [Dyadobacter flavalbus]